MTKAGADSSRADTAQRLDKWLWFARLAKSRTLAATAVAEGKIKVNRVRAEKPSQTVKVGDVVTSRMRKAVQVLKVAALGERRGPATEARLLYEDLTPPEPKAEGRLPAPQWAERDPGSGRPTKRDRRRINDFNGNDA